MTGLKAAARKAAFAQRKAAHGVVDPAPALEALLAWVAEAPARIIAGYLPIRTEIDPVPAMTKLAAHAQICVPVIDAEAQPLRFAKWEPGCALSEGPFGAMIPAKLHFLTPDTVIVPLVGFDARCARMGYGGGFYDRTLEVLRVGQVRAAGFAYSAQQIDCLPIEPTDQFLDAVVTESGVLRRT